MLFENVGVILYGGPRASAELNIPETHSFHYEFNSLACTIEIVNDVHAAINHINRYGRFEFSLIYVFSCW